MDANHMIRSKRINPDSLADGGGSSASRNPAAPAPAPKPSKDERAPDVVADTSRLAPYFPRTSLENRPASSSAALLSHHRYNVAVDTSHSQGPNLGSGGGSGIALSDCPLPLQWWGHGKRSRSRREAPVPEPELTRAEVRRRKSLKYRSRKAAKAQARAAMAPPGSPGPNLSAAPSPPPRAGTLWLHGYPRINSDSLPLADGGSGSVILRPVAPTPGPTQSKVERTLLVVADTSCLMPYFGRTSLEHHMIRGRPTSSTADHLYNVGMNTYQGPNVGGGSGGDIVHTPLDQHRLWGHAPHVPQPAYSSIVPVSHYLLNHAMHTSQGSNVSGGGGNGITSPNAHVPLQWGQRKRPRSRREAPAPTPAPKPELTPAKAQAQAVTSIVSSGAREPNLISDLSLPPRNVTLSLRCSAEELHNTVGEQQPTLKEEKVTPPPSALGPILSTISPHAATLSHHSSSEEPHTAAGEKQAGAKEEKQQPAVEEEKQQPAPKVEPKKQQRQESIKATAEQKGKAPMVEVPPHVEEEEEEKAAMARPVVPRVVTQLTHEEKEEDWLAMTVTRLPRFPHRRPGIVQKQVNNICPGEWLWQANRTRYKVKEKKSEKRVGGLKGMSTDDEDSDSD
ncbi:hypothetical protein CFC21_013684 [Triticum aestivum]|uniref:Uncharacterized protein n=2 Tax=Triticum aestivum TaxID=4565 RepID=A0A3B6A228_WHEAT|nr:uncharacterized protein LOC123183016 isoform X1 [Triticum aestivum]KAF6997466.1 hypothetical protein CFC21_013684 [Triticum aestivum]